MAELKPVYTGSVTSTGGGRDGHVTSDDQRIDLDVRPPQEMGGNGQGTNPEQLVAAGWAACFNGAMHAVAGQEKITLERDPKITVAATINKSSDGFTITAEINSKIHGLSQQEAEELVEKTHQFCPYSKAMSGNVEPTFTTTVD